MSTHTPPAPYPFLLSWFVGEAPDTARITTELSAMAQGHDFVRLLTALRLHDETDHFRSALQPAFPQIDLAAPHFPPPQQPLKVLAGAELKDVGASCLAAIALGEHEEDFNAKLFTWTDAGLCYNQVPVYCTVDGQRERLFVSGKRTLHITSAKHSLKGWLQRKQSDVLVETIHSVAPDDKASGYNALPAAGSLTWECSYGLIDTPERLIRAIAKSEAFGKITWGSSFCSSGWVSSLMPTLGTKGNFLTPAGVVTIGQNVHSSAVIGSAWIEGLAGIDCKQASFPQEWTDGVTATLLPRAALSTDLQNITTFCGILKQRGFQAQDRASMAERNKRITLLISLGTVQKETLRKLPNINDYYEKLF